MSATTDIPLTDRLRADVRVLAGDIGERHVWLPGRLDAAAQFVEAELTACGYAVARQGVEAEGRTVYNLEADLPGAGPAGT